MHYAADLTQRQETRRVIPTVLNIMGDVNILINNAGIIRRSPAIDYKEDDWDTVFLIHFFNAFMKHSVFLIPKDAFLCCFPVVCAFLADLQYLLDLPLFTAGKIPRHIQCDFI